MHFQGTEVCVFLGYPPPISLQARITEGPALTGPPVDASDVPQDLIPHGWARKVHTFPHLHQYLRLCLVSVSHSSEFE